MNYNNMAQLTAEEHLDSLFFVPTGDYGDIASRPYVVSGKNVDLEDVTDGFKSFGRNRLAGVASQILMPSSVAHGALPIINGMAMRRYVYFMRIVTSRSQTQREVVYVIGYTDYMGDPSYSGLIDPNMRMYITRVINVKEYMLPNGLWTQRMVSSSLLIPRNGGAFNQDSTAFVMRPRDMCNVIGNMTINNTDSQSDYRTSLASRGVLSNASNDLPADYLSRLFTAYSTQMAAASSAMGYATDAAEDMDNIAAATDDNATMSDAFLRTIKRSTRFMQGGNFSWGELQSIYPGVEQRAELFRQLPTQRSAVGFSEATSLESESWMKTKNHTMAAHMLANMVPAMMVGSMLTLVSFHVTNSTIITGEVAFEYNSEPMSFVSDLDLTDAMMYFRGQFLHEIFRVISNNGNMEVDAWVYCDLAAADIRININVDQGGYHKYVYPTFAQGIGTPNLTTDHNHLQDTAADIQSILNNLRPSNMDYPAMDSFNIDESFTIGGQPARDTMVGAPGYAPPAPASGNNYAPAGNGGGYGSGNNYNPGGNDANGGNNYGSGRRY